MDEETPEVIRAADDAYEAVRSINHLTITQVHAAPTVYSVLGNLKGLGHLLPQACMQLAKSLGRSLDEYDVYEDDGRDPVLSVAAATDHLTRAAELASELGAELEKAQTAISRQGYRDTPTS